MPIWYWEVSHLSQHKIPFLQDIAGTMPRQHRNTTITWAKHPKHHRTPSRHYGHTTKTRHQRTPKHNWETAKTPAGQAPPIPARTCKGVFPKMLPTYVISITIITTTSQQHHHHHHNHHHHHLKHLCVKTSLRWTHVRVRAPACRSIRL